MKKIILALIGTTLIPSAFAFDIFGESAINANSYRIDKNEYSQNMFNGTPTGGGTQVIDSYSDDSIARQIFGDGTWNAYGAGTASFNNPLNTTKNGSPAPISNNFGYAGTVWGQTGRVAGLALGAQVSVANPWFSNQLNGSYEYNNVPTQPENSLNQLYVEYMYGNHVQADIGWITISDSPWLVPANALGHIQVAAAYQGAEVQVNPGGGWILTGIGFNAMQLTGQSGFTGQTYLNGPSSMANGLLANGTNTDSAGTFAVGANYKALNNNFNLRLWGYNFNNYGNLLYADTSLNMNATDDLSFNVALQGGNDSASNGSTNALSSNVTKVVTNNSSGNINSDQIASTFAGGMVSATYDWAQIGAAYNSIWGPQGAFGQGAIVSPYTVAINTDPMFANSWNYNTVNVNSAGNGTKLFAKFTFLDGNLWFNPSWGTYTNTSPTWNGTQEWDMMISYSIPQVKGLNIFNIFVYEQMPAANSSPDLVMDQVVLSYTY